jgi:hypothetical protein
MRVHSATRSKAAARERHRCSKVNGRRRTLLRDLAAVARRLSDDELRVVLTIGIRTLGGQNRYGRMRLAHDRRDFRGEAFEEACDAAFYLAAGLLAPRGRISHDRVRGRRAGG